MPFRVYNTLTRQKEAFVPAHPKVVKLYSCGLTVYAPMHIGHARTYCFWDVFRRYLEYLGYHVMSVINYTDIDDRIMARAQEQYGQGLNNPGSLDLAESVAASFRRDCRSLHIKDYSVYTRATDFITGQIEHADALLKNGNAYNVDGELFYSVDSFPGYGKLSGRKVEEQEAGASGRVGEDVKRKRNPADFTLWKPSEDGQPMWETGRAEWSQGRPGWHLECSVMSTSVLGSNFDVHGGGIDNLFPHHENEIAQSEPLCEHKPWVSYWMHPEHLDLRGEKMSKSLGNVIGIPELLEKYRHDEVRWFYATTHYRTKLPFAEEVIDSALEGYRKITKLLGIIEERLAAETDEVLRIPSGGIYASLRPEDPADDHCAVPRLRHQLAYGEFAASSQKFMRKFREALDDDLNTPVATSAFFEYVSELYSGGVERSDDPASMLSAYRCLTQHLWVLGVERNDSRLQVARLFPELQADCVNTSDRSSVGDASQPYRDFIQRLLDLRLQARKDRDFRKADMLRDFMAQAGLIVEDTAEGSRWEWQ
jgi:cysteinyl-tRNA synthetase